MQRATFRLCLMALIVSCGLLVTRISTAAVDVSIRIATPMEPPRWAVLERQLLAENVPACREFFAKYFDDRGRLLCVLRWGANDGPDDAFENFAAPDRASRARLRPAACAHHEALCQHADRHASLASA